MFKCVHLPTGETILILEEAWRARIGELRRFDRQDLLVCQGCQQPVRVRAGRHRRWHFAHKHLQNCRFDQVSPAVLHARERLYTWLAKLLPTGRIDVEAFYPELNLPRPFDMVVEDGDKRFAYWIFENRLHPDLRQQITQAFEQASAVNSLQVHPIFLISLLRRDEKHPGRFFLSTTERAFAQTTPFDLLEQPLDRVAGKTLVYLDPDPDRVAILRDLHCIHTPQVFAGRESGLPLAEAVILLESGAIAASSEPDRLRDFQNRQKRRAAKMGQSQQSLGRVLQRILPQAAGPSGGDLARDVLEAGPGAARPLRPTVDSFLRERVVCQFCQQETEDWWYLDKKTGLCKCRDCLRKGIT
jgi:hypothetical protein